MTIAQIIIISVLALICLIQWVIFTYHAVSEDSDWKVVLSMFTITSIIVFTYFTCEFVVMNNKRLKTCPVYEKITIEAYKLKK